MPNYAQLKKGYKNIKVIRPPKYRLSTFGNSEIRYTLVTDVAGLLDRSRVRYGLVTAERPAILTPHTLKERFEGFGSKGRQYAEWVASQYGDALRGLEYQFRNEPHTSKVELEPPDSLLRRLAQEFDQEGDVRKTLIRGTDKLWELSLMKFIVEETLSSFASNVQELQDRGFFEGEFKDVNRQRREIKHLIGKVKHNKSLLPKLGTKLKEFGLFEEFQDEFFKLLKS